MAEQIGAGRAWLRKTVEDAILDRFKGDVRVVTRDTSTGLILEVTPATASSGFVGSVAAAADLPPLPKPDSNGNRPAVQYARAVIARTIIQRRTAVGWSQAELARRARLPVETLNRIERVRVTPDESTVKRIERALVTAERAASKVGTTRARHHSARG